MVARLPRNWVNRPRPPVDNRQVPNEPGPDETLSPDEAYAWSMIERSLRRELPLQRIERRARLRNDRAIVVAAVGAVTGALVFTAAVLIPVVLAVLAMALAGASLAVLVVRTWQSVSAARFGCGRVRPRRSLF